MKLVKLLAFLVAVAGMAVLTTSCGGDDDDGGGSVPLYQYNADSTVVTVTDNGQGTGTITWTADKTWVLANLVFVAEGQTLTIEPGTVIKGKASQGVTAASLVVARGARIIADGTVEAPIIFTAEEDDVSNPNEAIDQQRGLWGGVIILGAASQNTQPNEQAVEGIPPEETRAVYGGTNDADDSGILRYVSIRHGGSEIGAGNEINGLTLGCVGSGTVIENVEVVYNADDGVEFFGGTVNVKHAIVGFVGDDAIDYDQGYRGKIQYAVVIQGNGVGEGDRGGEFDGGTNPEDGTPYAIPTIYNATFIGGGQDSVSRRVITHRDNSGGKIYNSYFTEFGRGVDIEDLKDEAGEDSRNRLAAGDLVYRNNYFWNVTARPDSIGGLFYAVRPGEPIPGTDDNEPPTFFSLENEFNAGENMVGDLGLQISYTTNKGLNLVPSSPQTAPAPPNDGFFDPNANFVGAVGTVNWLKGWSFLDTHNYLAD